MIRRSRLVPIVMLFLLLMLSTTIHAAEAVHIAEPTQKMKAILEQASRDHENALSKEDLEKAAKNYQDILLFLGKYNLEKELGLALRGLGLVHFSQGEYSKSIECYEKALEKSRKAADHATEASVQENIGSVYVAWGQYHKALNYFTESLSSSTKLGESKTQGETLAELGNLYAAWGKFKQAQETYAAALEKSKSAHDSKIEALTLIRIGQLENKLGLYARATSRLDGAMVLSKSLGNKRFQATILTELGKGESDQTRPENALKYFEEALKVYKRIGIMPDSFTEVLGNTYLEAGRMQEAERFLRLTERESSMGRLYLIKGEHAKARPVYEVLLRSAEKNRSADNLFIAYTGLGIIYENAGNYQQAALYYSRATEQLEEIRAGLAQDERSTFFNVKIGGFYRTAPYEGLARVRILLNQPSEALRDSEYVKARTFAETVAGRFGTQANAVPKEMSLQDRELNQTLASLLKQRQQAEEKQNREVLESLEPQIKEARRKLNDYVDELRQKHPLYAAVAYPKPMDLDQSSLAPDEWTLAFAVTDTGVCIWLLNGKKIVKVHFKPIQRKNLDELVRRFREPFEGLKKSNFAQKLKSFDFQSGMKLSDCLLGDIISSLPKNVPVIIVPHDSLGVLPFEMLPLTTGGIIEMRKDVPCVTGAEFFGDRNPVSYNQSITALTLARTLGKHTESGDKVLIVADPVFEVNDTRAQHVTSQGTKLTSDEANLYRELMVAVEDGKVGSLRFERLALTGDLAKKLVDLYKGKTDLYKDLDANKERFLKNVAPNLHQFREIIFATHGYFGKDLPGIMEPVLVLTSVPSGVDAYLRMSEVMSLDMSADTVALTACQSGLGQTISGEGTMGMGRAFQYAGAKSVLMSLWSVAQGSSVQLVESFYRHRKQGKGKLEALRLARKEIRDSGFDHPFFWAPFILVGEVGTEPVGAQPASAPKVASTPQPPQAKPEPPPAPAITPLAKQERESQRRPESSASLMSPVKRDPAKDKDLLISAQSGDISKVKKLLAEGADMATTDAEYGATPLHWASYKGHKKVVTLLLGKGANVNAANKDGRTPLIMAAVAGHRDVVEVLLRHKADKAVKDKDGKTALDCAKNKNHDRIVRLLKR